jgi:hypothetical protein
VGCEIAENRRFQLVFVFLFVVFAAGIGSAKIFSNHWKMREKFFQSLEKIGRFSNHWKTFFQSLEKSVWADGLADCAPPGVGRGAGEGDGAEAGAGQGWME